MLKPREQKAVDGILRGESAAAAMRAAGYSASTAKNPAAFLERPEIATAIEAGRAELRESTKWTAEKIIGRLVELANGAALLNNHSAAVRALEIIAKMTGNLTERIQIEESPNLVEAISQARRRIDSIPPLSERRYLQAVDVPAAPAPAGTSPAPSPRYDGIFGD